MSAMKNEAANEIFDDSTSVSGQAERSGSSGAASL